MSLTPCQKQPISYRTLRPHRTFSEIFFVPQAINPPAPRHMYMPSFSVPTTQINLFLPDQNVWRFPSTVPANSVPAVGTSVNLNNVPLAQLNNPHVPTSPGSSTLVLAAVKSQFQVTSDYIMQHQQQPYYSLPSSPKKFGKPAQSNAPNTARQLSQVTMHFEGLQLDHKNLRKLSMPGQLILVRPSC